MFYGVLVTVRPAMNVPVFAGFVARVELEAVDIVVGCHCRDDSIVVVFETRKGEEENQKCCEVESETESSWEQGKPGLNTFLALARDHEQAP